MLWSNHYLILPSSGNWLATQFNLLWLEYIYEVICAFAELANFVHVEIPF